MQPSSWSYNVDDIYRALYSLSNTNGNMFVLYILVSFQKYTVFIHSVFWLTTGPKPPPKRCLHIVRSIASFFKWEYPLLSLRPSSTFLRLLPRLLATSISPFIFPSITCFRRQFILIYIITILLQRSQLNARCQFPASHRKSHSANLMQLH